MGFQDTNRRAGMRVAAEGAAGGTAASGLAPTVLVATRSGPVPAGRLQPGDAILTRDNGYRPLVWAGQGRRGATSAAARQVVAIAPGALGPGIPERTLLLASGHGVLVDATPLLAVFGTAEALIPAAARGVALRARPPGGFVQILLGAHDLILADGAWVESLAPEAAFRAFPRRALALADRLLAAAGAPLRPRILPADLALAPPAAVRPLRIA
ncbi:Hint domain-containing protein [Albidovulum sp.]|uniref:Hint domain-containing protein n=1 Tax=Albidovulum sp. TaxID=1872424 RepID=UPI0039B97D0E